MEYCISFTVEGNWAHFRKINTTIPKQTYRVVPRMTVAGLISAVIGLPRDSYYNYFTEENSKISITLQREPKVHNIASLDVSTEKGELEKSDELENFVKHETTYDSRQRRLYEYIKNPKYRIDAVLPDDIEEPFLQNIRENKSFYTPYLGSSECLSQIELIDDGVKEITDTNEELADSVVPASSVKTSDLESSISMERNGVAMENKKNGRVTTEFWSYCFSKDLSRIPTDANIHSVGDKNLYFK